MDEQRPVYADTDRMGTPAWRRFMAFPLVALFLALIALKLTSMVGGLFVNGIAKAISIDPSGDMPDWITLFVQPLLSVLAAIVAVKLVIRRLGAEPRDDLPFDILSRDFAIGIGAAAIIMSMIVGIAALLGGYRVSGLGGGDSLLWLLMVAGFKAAFVEEIVFRGVIFRFLEELAGSWVALMLSALMFGYLHHLNPDATLLTSLAIALQAGTLMAGAYMLTRNLWLAIGLHWGWNVTQGYVWDVPVSGIQVDGMLNAHPAGNPLISGGAFGLEGSLIATVLVTAAGLWLVVKAARLGRVVEPWWARRRKNLPLPQATGPLSLHLVPQDGRAGASLA